VCALRVLSVGTPRRTEVVITGGWCITCHGSTAHLQSARTCPSAASVYTAVYMRRYFFFFLWLECWPLLYVRTWYESHTKMKTWIFKLNWDVALYCTCVPRTYNWDVALYCTCVPRTYRTQKCCSILLVRTWHHTVFSCHKNSVFTNLHSKKHQFFWWDVSKKATSPAIVYTAVYMCHVFFLGGGWDLPTLKQTSVLLGCIKNSTISSKRWHRSNKQAYQQGALPPWACS